MARKMKDSGVEWIGEIPEEWNLTKLKFCTDIIMGQSPDSDFITGAGNILFMQGNREFGEKFPTPTLYCDKCSKHSRIGDILLSVRAPVGAINESDKVYGIGRGLCSIQGKGIDNDFLKYYLMKSVADLKYYSNGSTFDAITVDILNNFCISLPPYKEQVIIGKELNAKMEYVAIAIKNIGKIIEDYKKFRKAIIIKTTTKGIRHNICMKPTDSEWIGDIPEHWDYVRIGTLFQTVDERNDDPDAQLLSLYTALGVKPRSELEERGNKAVTVQNYKIVHKNDIIVNKLLAWMGAIGYSDYEGVTSPDYDVYRAKEGANVVRSFYNNYFRYTCFNGDCFKYGHGIMLMRWRTYPEEFLRIKVPNPPYDEQVEIAEYLDKKIPEIDKLISEKEELIKELENYKKSLIYEYVTGKKEVPVENVR